MRSSTFDIIRGRFAVCSVQLPGYTHYAATYLDAGLWGAAATGCVVVLLRCWSFTVYFVWYRKKARAKVPLAVAVYIRNINP